MPTLNCTYTFNLFTGVNPYLEEDFGQITSPVDVDVDYGNDLNPSNVACGGVQTQDLPNFSSTLFSFDNNLVTNDNNFELQAEDYGIITETSDLIPGEGSVPPYPPNAGKLSVGGGMSEETTRYVPHYGIDQNIGIGTIGLQFQGEVYIYLPVYPRGSDVPGSGQGTIGVTGIAGQIFSPQYTSTVPFIFIGTGPESFIRDTYIGNGSFDGFITGDAETQVNFLYDGYGDRAQPGTSGKIKLGLGDEEFILRNIASELGSGVISLSGTSIVPILTFGYQGSGTISALSGAAEVSVIQTEAVTDTAIFNIVGSGEESFSRIDPDDTILYIFNGQLVESRTKNHIVDVDPITLSGDASTLYVPSIVGLTEVRFPTYFVDDDKYDTCDNDNLLTDSESSADIAFVESVVENTILYQIDGDSITAVEFEYTAPNPVGTFNVSGNASDIKLTNVEVGGGNFISFSSGAIQIGPVYKGTGSLFVISGASESFSEKYEETSILLSVFGSAITNISPSFVGVGSYNITGNAITSEINSYLKVGSGLFVISGQVIFPDVKFIPSAVTGGTISILGSSQNSLSKIFNTSGTLFTLASGLESFVPDGYVGFGTINTVQLASEDSYIPFEIPRVFSIII